MRYSRVALILFLTLAGCAGGSTEPVSSPPAYYGGGVTLELVPPDEVHAGGRLDGLDILLTNHGEGRTFEHGGGGVIVFEVTDANENLVWRSSDAQFDVLILTTVDRGETIALSEPRHSSTVSWDLRDTEGGEIPAGEYYVKGVARLDSRELETHKHKLTVR